MQKPIIMTFAMDHKQEKSFGARLFIYLITLLVCLLLGTAISAVFGLGNINGLKWGQAVSSIMIFVVPPMILYVLTRPQPFKQLGFRPIHDWKVMLAGVAIMFVALPVINQLTEWNEAMKLPSSFSLLEDLMKSMEEQAAQLTEKMLCAENIGGLLVNLLVIALIPAIGEELTFRGVIQQSLTKGCRNAHVAIILTAAIFSAIHFQFYGFMPRMLLGVFLGYFFYTTQSLWVCIIMHFLNNGSAVMIYYLDHKGVIHANVDTFGSTSSPAILVASVILCVLLIAFAWRNRKEKPAFH